jgi:hypothetical protein
MLKWIVVLGVCALVAGCDDSGPSIDVQLRATEGAKRDAKWATTEAGFTAGKKKPRDSRSNRIYTEDDGSYLDEVPDQADYEDPDDDFANARGPMD